MSDVNKKILWLADHNLDTAPGGAQRSDEIIINQGKLLGYNILKVTAFTIHDELNIDFFDVIITSNIQLLLHKKPSLLEKIFKHRCHIRLEHDSNTYLSQENRVKLFSNCHKTIFLTDFHYSFFKQFYGDIFKNVEIVYDPIDLNNFKDFKNEREEKILYAGYLHPLKGAYNFFEYVLNNENKNFVVAGWASEKTIHHLLCSISNLEHLGQIEYNQMPYLYNKYKYMFYAPNINEPFCRSVAEAALCGMQILTNTPNKIGCLTEINKVGINQFREKCGKAGLNFWQIL